MANHQSDRPEGAPPWAQGAHYQRLGLESLSFDTSIRLVRNILGGLSLDPILEKKIVDKTEGNPLFVEEIKVFCRSGDLVKSGIGTSITVPSIIEIRTRSGLAAARMTVCEDLNKPCDRQRH
jgi:hypothetical protein